MTLTPWLRRYESPCGCVYLMRTARIERTCRAHRLPYNHGTAIEVLRYLEQRTREGRVAA